MAATATSIPPYDHIVVIVEENHSFSDIIGNSLAPYINSLAMSGALLTNFHAITHPSEPNYLALYAGSTFGITNDNNYDLSGPTLATILQDSGDTFLGYAETASPQKHNPWQSFPDAVSVGRDFSSFPSDFSQLPNVAFVIPNLQDDMHDGTIAQADQWIQSNLDNYAKWAITHNSLLVVTWDEGNAADPTNHIATILYGAAVNSGDFSDYYNFFNLLSTLLGAFGLIGPNNAASSGGIGNGVFALTAVPTTVQQEVFGLYAALYNRATDFGGVSYWVGVVGQQPDGSGLTTANAGTTAITGNDATLLGQLFVNTQGTYFNSVYGGLSDSAFINAMYVNIGGNAGDPGGIAYWANLLQQAEAGGQSPQAARAGLVGQFVHDLIGFNTSIRPPGLTDTQWQDALTRHAAINDKIAVSLDYSNTSQQPSGTILDVQSVGDPAYNAAITVLQGVTSDPTSLSVAITGISNAVAHHDLSLI